MKKIAVCFMAILMLLLLVACNDAVCQHRDADDDTLCDKCGESYTDGIDVTPEHTHEWSVWSVTTPATCQAKGVETRTCACGESETSDVAIDADAHTYDQKNLGTEYLKSPADCNNAAVYYYSCACGVKGSTTFTDGEANGHSYSFTWEKNATHHWHKATCEHTTEISGEEAHDYGTDNVCDTCGYDRTVSVSGVELNFSSLALTVDDVKTLIATITPNNATNQNVTWTTSNASIVAVDTNGKITAVGVGTATITVTTADGYKTAQCTVIVSAKVCPHTTTRTERENEVDSTCKVTGTYDEVVYCSTCGVELSRTAKIIPKKTTHTGGTPDHENIVDSTCKDTGSYDEVIYCSVCDVELSRTSHIIEKKATHTPASPVQENFVDSTCKAEGAYDEVVYCSVCEIELSRATKIIEKKSHAEVIDTAVAPTCTETGLTEGKHCSVCNKNLVAQTVVPALGHRYTEKNTNSKYLANLATGASAALYYYSCVCGVAGTETFSHGEALNIPVESISLSKNDINLEVGDSVALNVTFAPVDASDKIITWVSSNANIAIVNNGVVIGVNPGVTTVIAMTSNGKTASCRVEVSEKTYYAERITLSDSSLEIRIGEYYNLTATITPDYTTDKSLMWSSSAPDVVKVENGKITALSQGSATITATTTNGISASCTVTTVYVPVTEIVIDSSVIYVDAGGTVSPGITLLPENATVLSLNYTSSNESVATVSNGVITASSDGSTVITVSADGIVSNSFTVVVENSAGIKYEVSGDGYNVLSVPNPQETVVIPDTYKGKAVKTISINTFGAECSVIRYLYISKSVTIPDAALTNCTQLKKLVLYGGSFIWSPSSDPYDFYRFFRCVQISFAFAPGDLRPGCGSWSHSWEYCDGTCAWYVTNPEWKGWIYNTGTGEDWYWPHDRDYGVFFRRDAIIDWQTYNGYRVPKNIRMQVYKVPKSLEMFYDGYIILEPEVSTVCISAVDDLKIKFNGELLDIPLVSLVSHEDREKLHTIGRHNVTVYYGGFAETMVVNVGHVQNTVEENRVEETCTENGHCDLVVYCSTCKTEISRTEKTLEAHLAPKPAVEENRVEATCTKDGSYDSVIYCSVCNKELSRETITTIAPGHKPSDAIIENQVGAACLDGGNYDLVIYCSSCNGELSRTNEVIEKTGIHTISGGACIFCSIPQSSAGLEYSLNADGKSYTVTDIGTFSGTDLVIGIYNNMSVTSIDSNAFWDCNKLKSVTISDSVTSIGRDAFGYCDNLTSVTISDSVISIGSGAFESCKLISVTIPESVTSIGSEAFSCATLIEVINKSSINIVKGSEGYYNVLEVHSGESKIVNKDDYLFYTVDGMNYLVNYIGTKTQLTLPQNYNGKDYVINKRAFYNKENITSITIPDSVTSIGASAFSSCDNIKSITIPDSVTSIGRSAFSNCKSLTRITIPSGVTSISDEMFWYCTNLQSVTIPDSVTSIGQDVFQACFNITSIQFKGTKVQWNNISKGTLWAHSSTSYITVYCTDGTVRQTKG